MRLLSNRLKIVFSVFIMVALSAASEGFGQEREDKLLSEVLAEIMDPANVDQEEQRGPRRRSRSKNTVKRKSFINLNIVNDLRGKPVYEYLKENFSDHVEIAENGMVNIPKIINVTNCGFESDFILDSLNFNVFHVINSQAPGFTFARSNFSQNLTLDGNTSSTTIELVELEIKDLIIKNNQASKIKLNKLNMGTITALIGWFIWAYITYIVGIKLLPQPQTKADYGELLRTIGFASSPGLLRVFGIIPFLSAIIFFAASIWMLIAMVIAVRQALDYTGTLRAVGVCIIGWIIQMITFMVFFSIFGGLGTVAQ